ncbi:Uncharacterized protein SCF082_LOCUS18511 [Durusdinium trenchii]|uniref:DUF4476 domain-containing protein n=1 Tax=Durusdinium trenchii TaxID=1381693 RepID=A0ABP0KPG2_9DINO
MNDVVGEKEREPLTESMFEQKLAQVRNQPSERDRGRLLRNIAGNFTMSAQQAFELCNECHDSESKIAAGEALYEAVTDQEQFVETCVAKLFKFAEDREEFCQKLGVEYKEPEKRKSAAKPKVAKFDTNGVSGYSA